MMTKFEDYKDNLSDFNLIEFYKEFKPIALIITVPLFPLFFLGWIVWIVICTGGYFGELAFKDDA